VAFFSAYVVDPNVTPSVDRSTLKPPSVELVSTQLTRMLVAPSGVAAAFAGAEGGGNVVTDTISDHAELPNESYDRTR
jgi:hypothetical protein